MYLLVGIPILNMRKLGWGEAMNLDLSLAASRAALAPVNGEQDLHLCFALLAWKMQPAPSGLAALLKLEGIWKGSGDRM